MLPDHELVSCISAGSHYSVVVTESGYVYSFGSGAYGRLGNENAAQDVMVPTRVVALEGVGQLLDNGASSGVSLIAAGKWHTVAVAGETNDVYVFGWCRFGQGGAGQEELILPPSRITALDDVLRDDETVVQVTCGSRFTAVLTSRGRVCVL
jgi:alpha-tubulin suppressor-like RCC1 family protein